MKVVVNIKDNKADFFIELMKNLDFIEGVELNTGKKTDAKINKAKTVFANDELLSLISKKSAEWDQKSSAEKKAKFKAFKNLILNGPVMDDAQYEEYKQLRSRLNLWRQK